MNKSWDEKIEQYNLCENLQGNFFLTYVSIIWIHQYYFYE